MAHDDSALPFSGDMMTRVVNDMVARALSGGHARRDLELPVVGPPGSFWNPLVVSDDQVSQLEAARIDPWRSHQYIRRTAAHILLCESHAEGWGLTLEQATALLEEQPVELRPDADGARFAALLMRLFLQFKSSSEGPTSEAAKTQLKLLCRLTHAGEREAFQVRVFFASALARRGYPWLHIPPHRVDEYPKALATLRETGDTVPLVDLLLSSIPDDWGAPASQNQQ